MSDQNSAAQGRAAADKILDGMSDKGLQNDPNATLKDAGVNPEAAGGGEDVSGYALPVVPPRIIGGGGPEPTPPYVEGGEKGVPGALSSGGGGPEPTPPYVEGGGQKPAATDKPADW